MTTEWKELRTLQEVAAAQAAGDEVHEEYAGNWCIWNGYSWVSTNKYHSHPRKKTKTVVLREALQYRAELGYWTTWVEIPEKDIFVKWLDTPERTVEVDCDQP